MHKIELSLPVKECFQQTFGHQLSPAYAVVDATQKDRSFSSYVVPCQIYSTSKIFEHFYP